MKLGTILKAAAFVAFAYFCVKQILIHQSWPETTGTITTITHKPQNGGSYYVVKINVSYTVDGHTYSDVGTREVKRQTLDGTLSQNKPGTSVKVKYDPQFPQDAMITTPGWDGLKL